MYTLEVTGAFRIDQPQGTYIYHLEPVADEIAAISSDDCLRLVNPTSLHGPALKVIPKVHAEVTCLKALEGQNFIVCTAGRDGRINIWDLRGNANVAELKTTQNAPVLSLAASSTAYAVAAGTELTNSKATVTIWDTRSLQAPRLEYVESHSDDVTELQYHPSLSSILLSGSTDGLVNLYDTKISEEEDALYQTINHGSSIHHAGFLTDVDVFALSHDEKFSMYEMITNPAEDVEEPPPVNFGDLRERLGCEYVANILPRPGGGAVAGMGSHSTEKFDLVQLRNDKPWKFVSESSVTLSGAHGSEIVRSFCFLDKHKMVLTAGEDSQIRAFQSR